MILIKMSHIVSSTIPFPHHDKFVKASDQISTWSTWASTEPNWY